MGQSPVLNLASGHDRGRLASASAMSSRRRSSGAAGGQPSGRDLERALRTGACAGWERSGASGRGRAGLDAVRVHVRRQRRARGGSADLVPGALHLALAAPTYQSRLARPGWRVAHPSLRQRDRPGLTGRGGSVRQRSCHRWLLTTSRPSKRGRGRHRHGSPGAWPIAKVEMRSGIKRNHENFRSTRNMTCLAGSYVLPCDRTRPVSPNRHAYAFG